MTKGQVYQSQLSQAYDCLKEGHFAETAVGQMQVACLSEHIAFAQPVMAVQQDQADLALNVTDELAERTDTAGFDQQASQDLKENPVLKAETAGMQTDQRAVLAVLEQLTETIEETIFHETLSPNSYKRMDNITH